MKIVHEIFLLACGCVPSRIVYTTMVKVGKIPSFFAAAAAAVVYVESSESLVVKSIKMIRLFILVKPVKRGESEAEMLHEFMIF